MANDRRLRIETGVIIRALEAQIEALKAVPHTDPQFSNALWKQYRLADQIEALKWRPTIEQVSGWGGEWLGVIRHWMQSNARNGSDVTWGSHDQLFVTTMLTPFALEQLAARIAQAAINDHMGTWINPKEIKADGK
jgi:hypothetical protein